jgi:hypothetical protein
MSHDATAWARKQKTGSMSAKFILLLLADYAGTDYSCWPSVAKLAEEAEMGESTVRAATKLLAEAGLIRVYYRQRQGGFLRRSSRYQLLVDGPGTEEPDADDWCSHRQIPAEDDATAESQRIPAPDSSGSMRQDLAVIPYKEPSLKEPPALIPGASRTARATRIPDNFEPTEEMRRWFFAENFHTAITNPRQEHESFCDYWRAKAGGDARKVDWPAAWRNWMRRAASHASRNGFSVTAGPKVQSTTDLKVQSTLDLAERFRKMEENQ